MKEESTTEGRRILKELLSQCTDKEQHMFKRMYSHENLELNINQVVDQMNESKINLAIKQCERTVQKKNQS